MMMETAVYDRAFLFAREMRDRGEFGTFTLFKGAYYQDLEGEYPAYWRAQPPMHYATHVVAPILALAEARATRVSCLGAGRLRADIQVPGGNVFPLQTAIFRLEGTDAAVEITRSWFQTAHPYTEAFSAYGDAAGFEWQQLEAEKPLVHRLDPVVPGRRGRHVSSERVAPSFRPDLLPPELAPFADGGHGGSHPHLAHEFVRSVVENRPSAIDARRAAAWCAPGICANESAVREGERIEIPDFAAKPSTPLETV